LHCGTQDYSELFPKLSNDNTVKIILRLIKRHSPAANDEMNSKLEVQHGVGHQFSSNSFQNKKLSYSNEIQSLKEKLQTAINEKLLTVPAKRKGQSPENMAENDIRFFEVEVIIEDKPATPLTTSVQQHHLAQDPKGPFLPPIKCVPKLCPVQTITLLLACVATELTVFGQFVWMLKHNSNIQV